VGWIDVVYGGADPTALRMPVAKGINVVATVTTNSPWNTDVLPLSRHCGIAHRRPGPPPWNNTPAIEPPQWDRRPLILIRCHGAAHPDLSHCRGTTHHRPNHRVEQMRQWHPPHIIEAPTGSECHVVSTMNPCRRWNPSGGGELATLGIGGGEIHWDGTLDPYK
jgi:hypothetical protein